MNRASIVGTLVALGCSLTTLADEARPRANVEGWTSVTLGALISIQPEDYTYTRGFLLDNGIGGTKGGISFAIEHHMARRAILTLALSTTLRMEASQSGRFVSPEAGAPCGPFPGSGCVPL